MPGKARITIYLDRDVVDWFKVRARESSEGQYQTLINDALREHVDYERTDLESIFRKVLREELGKKATRQRK
jgi:hypothetical protein